jgi:molecular chaperone GrpE
MIIEPENQTETKIETTVDNIEQSPELKQKSTDEQQQTNSSAQQDNNVTVEREKSSTQEGDSQIDDSLDSNSPSTSEFASEKTESFPSAPSEEEIVQEESEALAHPQIIANLQGEINDLREQLEQEKQQHQSLKAQYTRLVADFENYRRRTTKEQQDLQQQAKKKTINELLSVVDNFERARTQIKPANDGEMAIHKSYQGVYKNFVDSLKKIGVAAMRPEGKPFDPNYHEAMLREPTTEYEDGVVIEQLVRGYLLNDEVLRHAMVKVAVNEGDLESEESQPQQPESPETETN